MRTGLSVIAAIQLVLPLVTAFDNQFYPITLSKQLASRALFSHRSKRSNSDFFEEIKDKPNFERECLEERCTQIELMEVVNKANPDNIPKEQFLADKKTQIFNRCFYNTQNGLRVCSQWGSTDCRNKYNGFDCVCKEGVFGEFCDECGPGEMVDVDRCVPIPVTVPETTTVVVPETTPEPMKDVTEPVTVKPESVTESVTEPATEAPEPDDNEATPGMTPKIP